MDVRIRRYREVLNWFTQHTFIEPKSVPLVDEEGVEVEDFNYVRQIDTQSYLGNRINILVGDDGVVLIKHDILPQKSCKQHN